MQAITDGIYYQDAYAGVTLGAIILPHGTLLIDSPLKSDDARSWKSIQLTQSRGMHRLLVNLDEHTDRTIGNRYMDLTIIAHQKVAQVFSGRAAVFKGQATESGAEWEQFPEIIGSRWTQPSLTFNQHLKLHWSDLEICLDHHAGPTAGSIWVEIASRKIAFIGDCVLKNQPPFLAFANIPVWLENLNLLLSGKYDGYTIVSGRSGVITLEDVQNQLTFLTEVYETLETYSRTSTFDARFDQLVSDLVAKFDHPPHLELFYSHRLRYGLNQYYLNHYSPTELSSEG
jgi:glyoxylase-like metal-dependent hydrolase (beta-lactamase superfamily II)